MKIIHYSWLTACVVLLLLVASPTFACDLCAVYRSREAKTSKPGLNIGAFEQFTYFSTLQQDGHRVDNPSNQHLASSITQFIVGYQLNERFGVQVNIPQIHRSFHRPDGLGGFDRGSESGLGDMALLGQLRVFQYLATDTVFFLDLQGGIKFPTGSSERLREELSEEEDAVGPPSGIHGHDLALGSGSYDGIIGAAAFARWQRLFLTSGFHYSVRTRGDFNYRYANDLTWYVKPGGYLWLTHENTFGLQFSIAGENKGRDNLAGSVAEDTGIRSVFLGPEISFTWKENLNAELGLEIPVTIDNTALQIVPDYRVKAALTWRF